MKASQQLRKPENWPDFESLCKKLWGEIWNCPEIKKNGRQGQNQHGVDIYGIPDFDSEYYGIQCKGKDEYTHKQLTKDEIDKELKKALDFKPKLKKLYFVSISVLFVPGISVKMCQSERWCNSTKKMLFAC